MCHMFLVPVFETGSLRTFQLSPHTEAARARRGGGGRRGRRKQKDIQKRDGEGGMRHGTDGRE